MSQPWVQILRPGVQTSVQDTGRWGFQARGVPVSGPMDPYAHRLANALVGNDPRAATLEVTLVGPEMLFEDDRQIAVVGAAFDLTVNGRSVPTSAPIPVGAGSHVRFGARSRGSRAYVAVAGGIDVPLVLGSRATHLVSRMGGVAGRALAAGDRLPLGPERGERRRISERLRPVNLPRPTTITPGGVARVRVLLGPQQERFTEQSLTVLQSAPYRVGQDSSRMGFRLEGPPLGHAGDAEIVSDATPLGVLQVPRSGQPLLLMADRPTAGGYPKIATVITADVGIAGQLAPGDYIQFVVCDEAEALAALADRERRLAELEAGCPS